MQKLQQMYVRMINQVNALAVPQKGQGLVEYVLIVALISIIAIAIMTTVGGQVQEVFQAVSTALQAGLDSGTTTTTTTP